MIKKFCSRCHKFSYSAAQARKWICPTCGCDISHTPVMCLDNLDMEGVRRTTLKLVRKNYSEGL